MGNELKGTHVPSTIVPTSAEDTYPTHDDTYGKGGYRSVDTRQDMENIPIERLKIGTRIHVNQENKDYTISTINEVTGEFTYEDASIGQVVDKLLVVPSMHGTWEIINKSSTVVETKTDKNIVVESGFTARLKARFKWIAETGKKSPTACSGDLGTTLPASNVDSDEVTLSTTTSKTYKETISAPKSGLMVSGTSVVAAEGNDTTSDSMSVTFKYRGYYGVTSAGSPRESDIKALANNDLQTSRARTVSGVTASNNQYYCYAYPKSLGALTSIIQNGAAPVLEDFNRTEVNIVTASGATVVYYVYTSKNKGAFQNVTLAFS